MMSGGPPGEGPTILVDRELCIGSGNCAFTAPDIFDVDGGARAVVIARPAFGDQRVHEAIASCPMDALSICESE